MTITLPHLLLYFACAGGLVAFVLVMDWWLFKRHDKEFMYQLLDEMQVLSTQVANVLHKEKVAEFETKINQEVYCNVCEKKLSQWDLNEDFTLHKYVGYGSTHDGEEVDIHLCCECFDWLIMECNRNPIVRTYDD